MSALSVMHICVFVSTYGLGAEVGPRVAVIGAGGIGFDVADFLTHPVRCIRAAVCMYELQLI